MSAIQSERILRTFIFSTALLALLFNVRLACSCVGANTYLSSALKIDIPDQEPPPATIQAIKSRISAELVGKSFKQLATECQHPQKTADGFYFYTLPCVLTWDMTNLAQYLAASANNQNLHITHSLSPSPIWLDTIDFEIHSDANGITESIDVQYTHTMHAAGIAITLLIVYLVAYETYRASARTKPSTHKNPAIAVPENEWD